jgi:mannose-6-phosphate isomerase-like protein (cupin superfamily)
MTSMTPMTRTATLRARDGRQLRSGRRQGWAHRHGVAEEIYVALSGSGRIKFDWWST